MQRVRVAETNPGTTRVVVDLAGPVEINTSQLSNPHRLIIELRAGRGPVIPSGPALPAVKPPPVIRAEVPKSDAPAGKAGGRGAASPLELKVGSAGTQSRTGAVTGQTAECARGEGQSTAAGRARGVDRRSAPASPPAASTTEPMPIIQPRCRPHPAPGEFSKGARRTSTGGNSLTRALGLKVGRIVIDAGHGGHDQGTQGPTVCWKRNWCWMSRCGSAS